MPIESRFIRPCGAQFCPAATRIVWGIDYMLLTNSAKILGISPGTLIHRAGRLDLPTHARAKNKPKATMAAIRAAWADEKTNLKVLAANLGMSDIALRQRARSLGLPHRKGSPKKRYFFPADFKLMWMAGVFAMDIAALVGCKRSTVSREAQKQGLPMRNPHAKAKQITIDQYRELRLWAAMAATARAEQDAIILSEMADRRVDNTTVGSISAMAKNAA